MFVDDKVEALRVLGGATEILRVLGGGVGEENVSVGGEYDEADSEEFDMVPTHEPPCTCCEIVVYQHCPRTVRLRVD